MFDPNNDFWQFISHITDVVGLTLCWLFLSLPLVTAGAATTALYDAIFHGIRRQEDRVYLRFWNTFRSNLKVGAFWSLLGAGGFLLCAFLWNVTYVMALGAQGRPMAVVLLVAYRILFSLLLALWLFGPMILSRFEFAFGGLLKTSIQLVFSHLPSALLIGILALETALLCVQYWFPVLFLPGVVTLLATFPMERIFRPFLPPEEEE